MLLDELNRAAPADFVAALGNVFEHSPWVAEAAATRRPFASREALHQAMMAAVLAAPEARQLEFLCAHPELAGRAAQTGAMTAFSTDEQGASGLLHCSAEELETLRSLNQRYRARFGFPFILAVRGLARTQIIATFTVRLDNPRAVEITEALAQVRRITGMRLAALVAEATST